jgi:hypothetical protein
MRLTRTLPLASGQPFLIIFGDPRPEPSSLLRGELLTALLRWAVAACSMCRKPMPATIQVMMAICKSAGW